MFIGEYNTQIGDKNRIAIPKKLRINMQDSIFLTRGYEQCLILIDQPRWNNLIQNISSKSLLSLDIRDSKRFIMGGAHEVEPDNQGRFVIPEGLIKYSQMEEKVSFIGLGEWVEIWPTEKWETKLKNLSSNVSDIANRLSNYES